MGVFVLPAPSMLGHEAWLPLPIQGHSSWQMSFVLCLGPRYCLTFFNFLIPCPYYLVYLVPILNSSPFTQFEYLFCFLLGPDRYQRPTTESTRQLLNLSGLQSHRLKDWISTSQGIGLINPIIINPSMG